MVVDVWQLDNFTFVQWIGHAGRAAKMTFNEAVVEAREQASKTSRSCFIFTDGRDNFRVGDNRTTFRNVKKPGNGDLQLAAVVDPVWKE